MDYHENVTVAHKKIVADAKNARVVEAAEIVRQLRILLRSTSPTPVSDEALDRTIAKIFDVTESTIQRWARRLAVPKNTAAYHDGMVAARKLLTNPKTGEPLVAILPPSSAKKSMHASRYLTLIKEAQEKKRIRDVENTVPEDIVKLREGKIRSAPRTPRSAPTVVKHQDPTATIMLTLAGGIAAGAVLMALAAVFL